MKKIHNYIMLLAVALAFAGCADDEIVNIREQAQTGDEVKFGLSLERLSRTVYGDEVTGKDENNQVTKSFPIYWVDGDKVLIFSPDCLEGRQDAEYKVVLPDEGNAYYAKDLVKTSANGVQWGDAEMATFYSLYPSGLYGLSSDDDNKPVVKGLFINYNQNILVDGTSIKSDMEDCLMYAKTTANKGDVVNLQYNPIATVFMLTLNADASSAENFVIQSVSIQSADNSAGEKTYLAGSFGIYVDGGTFAGWGDNKGNIVSAAITDKATGGYFTLQKGNSIQIPLFMAPVSDLNTNGWKIVVKTIVNGTPQTFIKTLDGRDVQAGKIHKVILPKLSIKQEEIKDWDPATWMVSIPRNVYLSEVSIPGTWNSLNGDFQSKTSITAQYGLGVRSFHLDTRWKASRNGTAGQIYNPTITALSVCDGSTSYSVLGADGRVMGTGAETFESCLSTVVRCLNKDEYMVVFCTFAQDSYSGNNCPSTWMQAVSDACDKINNSTDIALKGRIYDASKLTPNTLVGDVLNHVIVVVNLDTSVADATLPNSSKCLFTYVPMNLPEDHYTGTNATEAGHVDLLYYSTKASSGISMHTSHAQMSTEGSTSVNCGDRGFSHPLTKRDALVESIWNWSKSNYGSDNYGHNKWIYLGLGGNISTRSDGKGDGYTTIENRYATKIYTRIEAMGKNNVPFYPVGIVLMNNKQNSNYTDGNGEDLGYGFSDVCKEILLLNNKYQLQYDPNKTEDYNPNLLPASEYNAVVLNGGAVFQ